MSQQLGDREGYWTSFYKGESRHRRLMPPSQFAAFVAQELDSDSVIFDVGCGNGRDSLFFAEMGFKVVSLDGCKDAIFLVEEHAKERELNNIKFIVGDVTGPKLREAIEQLAFTKLCIYARFFLHAISEQEQSVFLRTLSTNLKSGSLVAFEYRTVDDQCLQKQASPHFRRYQSSENLNAALQKAGFRKIYAIEGQGFAKYKVDDAVVARCIFEKV